MLTELFAQQIGQRPVSFRAGRFGVSEHTGRILSELGYRVDSSVTPHVVWTDKQGRKLPDFRNSPEFPYRVGPAGNLWQPGPGKLLEVPVTILAGANPDEPRWFRPWYSDTNTLCDILRRVAAEPPCGGICRPLVMMFHNVELVAGASPYPQTEADVQKFLDSMRRVFELARELGIRPGTLAEYEQEFAAAEQGIARQPGVGTNPNAASRPHEISSPTAARRLRRSCCCRRP